GGESQSELKAEFSGPGGELRARRDAQLVEDVCDMVGGGPLANHQLVGNLPVAEATRDQRGDFPLPWREQHGRLDPRIPRYSVARPGRDIVDRESVSDDISQRHRPALGGERVEALGADGSARRGQPDVVRLEI